MPSTKVVPNDSDATDTTVDNAAFGLDEEKDRVVAMQKASKLDWEPTWVDPKSGAMVSGAHVWDKELGRYKKIFMVGEDKRCFDPKLHLAERPGNSS